MQELALLSLPSSRQQTDSNSSNISSNGDERSLGIVETPQNVVEFMVDLSGVRHVRDLHTLEPACRHSPFLQRIMQECPLRNHTYLGVEIEEPRLWGKPANQTGCRILQEDFLLWNPKRRFDLVIGNPPYGIVGHESHYPIHILRERKRQYRQVLSTWKGKYNMYGAFIEKAVRLLNPDGRLVFVVPATFMVLDDFFELRKFLAVHGKVSVHYLGKVFKNRQVIACVLVLKLGGKGLEIWEWDRFHSSTDVYDGDLIRFESEETKRFEDGKVRLGELFSMHFAARSPEVREHPLTLEHQAFGYVPVLTGRNLKSGLIDYETCSSGYWFPHKESYQLRPFYAFPHIVVGHTKGGRVEAALDELCYPWREEIHLVPKRQGIDLREVVDYLNNREVAEYMRALYRDITPHLTITQLKLIPLPRRFLHTSVSPQSTLVDEGLSLDTL